MPLYSCLSVKYVLQMMEYHAFHAVSVRPMQLSTHMVNLVLVLGYCACSTEFYLNADDANNNYCDRCHTSCATCFGPLEGNCITCSSKFNFNPNGSLCTPPNNSTDQVLVQGYSFFGFSPMSGWSVPTSSSTTMQCG
jgi:hypothetical protein